MTDYTSIEEAAKVGKGNLIVKVIAISDISEGKSDKGPWRKQSATLQDKTGEIKLTMWGDDVGMLDQGQLYKFEGLFWKEYEGKQTPQVGKFTKVKLAGPEEFVEASMPKSKGTDGFEQSVPDNSTAIPKLPEEVKQFIKHNTLELLQIEAEVIEMFQEFNPDNVKNGQKIGMYTRTIFARMHESVGQN